MTLLSNNGSFAPRQMCVLSECSIYLCFRTFTGAPTTHTCINIGNMTSTGQYDYFDVDHEDDDVEDHFLVFSITSKYYCVKFVKSDLLILIMQGLLWNLFQGAVKSLSKTFCSISYLCHAFLSCCVTSYKQMSSCRSLLIDIFSMIQ